jgi:hypothetical protein
VHRLTWGADTITAVRFNQTETDVLASAGNDRTITFYDLRAASPLTRVVLEVHRATARASSGRVQLPMRA